MKRLALLVLICLFGALTFTTVSGKASAAICTLSVSPTGGYSPLSVQAVNSVTLQDSTSVWLEADFYFERYGGPHMDPVVVYPADVTGGEASVGVVLNDTGTYGTYVIDSGQAPAGGSPWYQSAQGPNVTVVHYF